VSVFCEIFVKFNANDEEVLEVSLQGGKVALLSLFLRCYDA
jgi:hypothetical protein